MAHFELCPEKSNCVRASTLGGTIQLESPDNKTARVLLNVLNSFVSDIVIDRQSRSTDTTPERVPHSQAIAPSIWWTLLALLLIGIGIAAFWLGI
jgi:hypothetical protein